jgi:hypothetical protein
VPRGEQAERGGTGNGGLLTRLLAVVLKPAAFRSAVCSDPMKGKPHGLPDKLYWRRARGEWHCFRKLPQVRGYISLCQRREISFVQGLQIARPEAHLRCSERHAVGMARRGWDGSLFAQQERRIATESRLRHTMGFECPIP